MFWFHFWAFIMQKKNPSKNCHHCIFHFFNLASQQSLYDHVCLFVICPQQWNTCMYTCWTDIGYKEKKGWWWEWEKLHLHFVKWATEFFIIIFYKNSLLSTPGSSSIVNISVLFHCKVLQQHLLPLSNISANNQSPSSFRVFIFSIQLSSSRVRVLGNKEFQRMDSQMQQRKNKGFIFFTQKHIIERWETHVHKMRSKDKQIAKKKITTKVREKEHKTYTGIIITFMCTFWSPYRFESSILIPAAIFVVSKALWQNTYKT